MQPAARAANRRRDARATLLASPRAIVLREMLRLLQADLSQVHGTLRLPLLAVVQGEGQFSRYPSAGLCRPKVAGRGPLLATRRPFGLGGGRLGRGVDRIVDLVRLGPLGAEAGFLRALPRN